MTADRTLMRYLLGELGPEEEATLDERVFVDDAWAEECGAAADDLIGAYLAGRLDADQQQRFETHFLASSSHRERLRLIQDLERVVDRSASAGPHRPRPLPNRASVWWAVAAAVVAVVAALVLYAIAPSKDRPQVVVASPTVEPFRTATPATRDSPTGTPISRDTPRPEIERVALPDRPGPIDVGIRAHASVVRFTVAVPTDGPSTYAASVLHDGQTVWHQDDLGAAAIGGPLEIDVPAAVLVGTDIALSIEAENLRGLSPTPARVWALRPVRRP